MENLCPNCKANADIVSIVGVDYIQCPECGWFKTQPDGSMIACDEPQQQPGQEPAETSHPQSSPASTTQGDASPVESTSPCQPGLEDKPGPEDDDDWEDWEDATLTFED